MKSRTSTAKPRPAYRNPALPPERRAKDLLQRMTLPEKAAQLQCIWRQRDTTFLDAQGHFDLAKAKRTLKHGLGQVGRPSDVGGPSAGLNARDMAALTNDLQRFFRDHTRLGIPVLIHEECLHGHAARDGTSFPQPIGLAATFNPDLVEALFTMTAYETRSRGAHHALTPVVDVAREPRWGRVEETYGEDPYLVSRMAVAAVRGFQGDASFKNKRRIIATLKHFAAHGQPESGMNCAPANISERTLRDNILCTFKAAVQEGGALCIMPSYNEIDGIPSHANTWLLRNVLRKEWGFNGFLISDYCAIWELADRPDTHGHNVARDKKEACALAIRAGVNIEAPDPDCYLHLVELVKKRLLKESQLDELVLPILRLKFHMGLFEDPFVDPDEADRIVGCDAHRALARQAARETITLLKNDHNLAPLNLAHIKTIAVIGPNAAECHLGGYSHIPKHQISVLDGIKARVGDRAQVLYAEGCKITLSNSWIQDDVRLPAPEDDRRSIAEAVALARQSDIIILALGGNEQTSREAWSRKHMGDRARLELIGRQDELAAALAATGKPVIALLFNGRPLAITTLAQTVPTLFECWYLGQETGHAIADVLFGDHNPAGKLPITFPRSAGHLPAYYNHKPSARRGYLLDDVTPLFPFGFGLSYTTFTFGKPRLEKRRITRTGRTRILIDITNTGPRAGEEVVQLYIRDRVSTVTRPIKELKAFRKVHLDPGQTTTVALPITPDSLAFHNIDMKYTVEPGDFDIMVGNSSRDADLQKVLLTVV